MLDLVMSPYRDVRRDTMMNKIRELQKAGFTKIFVLTPEQSTYVMDKECCRLLGNDFANQYVQVVGF